MTTNTGRTAAGGVAGTLVMTAVMYGVAPMMGVHMDIAAMLGSMLGGSWAAGFGMHLMLGSLVFPIAYAEVVRQRLPGAEAVRGILFGVGLWLAAQVMVMPMMGGGFFSANAGGPMAAMGSMVGHVLYGATLGAIAGAKSRVPARA
jgi:uncharacterized membrane protein YagU involved in acid resistance